MAIGDGGGKLDELAVVAPRPRAQHLKRALLVDRMAFHEDPLSPFDQERESVRPLVGDRDTERLGRVREPIHDPILNRPA